MGVKIYLFLGALTGLVAGILIDVVRVTPAAYLRLTHVALFVFAASIAAFLSVGARVATDGREPPIPTAQERRRRPFDFMRRRRT